MATRFSVFNFLSNRLATVPAGIKHMTINKIRFFFSFSFFLKKYSNV
jgi:hypothetical protein